MPISIDRFEEEPIDALDLQEGTQPYRILQFLAEHSEQAFTQTEINEATEIKRGSVGAVLSRLDIWAEINGERLQDSSTSNFIFGVDEVVSFCSQAFTLKPGDLIFTGTPPGVGHYREPPVHLGDGDEVTIGIEGLGELRNDCAFD